MPHGRFGFSPLDSGSGCVSEDVWPLVDVSELESDSGILSRLKNTQTHFRVPSVWTDFPGYRVWVNSVGDSSKMNIGVLKFL